MVVHRFPILRRTLLIAAVATLTFAAPSSAVAQPASCRQSFDFVVAKIEQNYSGFRDKVTPATRAAYDRTTAAQRRRADGTSTDEECSAVLHDWIAFFRDGHMDLYYYLTSPKVVDTPAVRARFARWPARALSRAEAERYYARNAGRLDPIEGIWKLVRGMDMELAVVRDSSGTGFEGVLLNGDGVWWQTGQIKARFRPLDDGWYEGILYSRTHAELARGRWQVMRNILSSRWMSSGIDFAKLSPTVTDSLDVQRYLASVGGEKPQLQSLDARTLLLRLPSFASPQAPLVDTLLKAHRDALLRTPDLIIDLRNNIGGSDHVWSPVISFLYTQPMTAVGVVIYSTEDNIGQSEKVLKDPVFPDSLKVGIRKRIETLRAHLGEFSASYPPVVIRRDTVYENPRRVAVLVDRTCTSSCEEFILKARQSSKVTLFGQHTGGVLDYSNTNDLNVPDSPFILRYPISRSLRLPRDPVDPHGITPAVRIPAGEPWPVEWIRRYLEEHPATSPQLDKPSKQ